MKIRDLHDQDPPADPAEVSAEDLECAQHLASITCHCFVLNGELNGPYDQRLVGLAMALILGTFAGSYPDPAAAIRATADAAEGLLPELQARQAAAERGGAVLQ